MILGGDVGGTKTLLGLFEPAARPRVVTTQHYQNSDYGSFQELLARFMRGAGSATTIDAAAIGVAGPVIGNAASMTNLSWTIDGREIGAAIGTERVEVINDLVATAHAVDALTPDEVLVLQPGTRRADGNAAVIAAGTGLGEALLHRIDGRLLPMATEGGHADYAPRTDRELELVRMLRELYGRAEVEQVLSGPGLVNLHRFTHRGGECEMVAGVDEADKPARISQGGLGGRCQGCADALRMFVAAYGAEAGNLALRSMATSGVYVGGGIAPKILPALKTNVFIDAFVSKEPMRHLLADIPVTVILNADAGLLGAAVRAQQLLGRTA